LCGKEGQSGFDPLRDEVAEERFLLPGTLVADGVLLEGGDVEVVGAPAVECLILSVEQFEAANFLGAAGTPKFAFGEGEMFGLGVVDHLLHKAVGETVVSEDAYEEQPSTEELDDSHEYPT
jgi:hypothetical protein